ncbi:EAL and HDOD domain-containing protein [Desulfonatronum thiodismutans]|uniref:EAL and HDOD domain-containing protein n=1 Tax=Desulfonatronum thiodismutans TaxID=159290 RepID=UPI0004ABD55C|nr:HDOD domain-containing protein [Desulfonatronum thiodismutans]
MRIDLKANWGPLPFFVGRQPIFDQSRNIWGYQFFHRATAASVAASFEDGSEATLEIIRNIAMNPLLDPHGQTKNMIAFTRENVVRSAPFAMPPGKTVVKYLGPRAEPSIHERLQELREAGYPLAWEDDAEAAVPVVSGIDILILDAMTAPEHRISDAILAAQAANVLVMAKRVETHAVFEQLKHHGVNLFQGFFFQKPETLHGPRLTSHHALRFKLLAILNEDQPNPDKLADVLEKDVALSYRLLRYVNSARFSPVTKITSIRRALSFIGLKHVRHMLEVILVKETTLPGKPHELPFSAALRGKFLQSAASGSPLENVTSESLFLLGLLSLLEALLDLPMPDILRNLPLEEDFKAGLCRQEGSPYLPWMKLADAFERSDWDVADACINELGLDPLRVASSYAEAADWTQTFFQHAY